MAQGRPELLATGRKANPAWSDLRLRFLSAIVLAPLASFAIWHGGLPWMALIAAGFLGLAAEWTQLCRRPAFSPAGFALMALVLLAGLAAFAGHDGIALAILVAGTMLVRGLLRGDPELPSLALGVPYIGVALVALIWLRGTDTTGRDNLLFVVFVVWATDIGAYLVGRLVGGPKLAPSISPGKTISGAAGGLAAAMLLPPALLSLLGDGWRLDASLVAALLSVVAQAGDLMESAIKRRFGVKDSGWLIPGHGGLFDRLDGVLTAAPVAAALAYCVGRGVLL